MGAVLLGALVGGAEIGDTVPQKRDWRQEKCFRYGRDWDEALRRYGFDGLSKSFVAGNADFISGGCVARRKICPTTAKDRKLVDVLAIRVVNAGMSPTFLPFGCP